MKRHRISTLMFCLLGLAAIMALSGCIDINLFEDGDLCSWRYIKTENKTICQTGEPCSDTFRDAQDVRRCPPRYSKCTFDDEGTQICVAECIDPERPKLCNGKCISEAAYAHAVIEDRDGVEFCDYCSHCALGCYEDGTCRCPITCVGGCDADGVCQCPETCANGCDENGACKCPITCINGCDDNGACRCSQACKDSCDERGRCIVWDD